MKREIGIDLLKMLAMLMVVAGHIMYWGGVTEACSVDTHSLKYGIEFLFTLFCKPAVDCFVLATGYIMWRKECRYTRVFRLWGEIVFYSLFLMAVAAYSCPHVDITIRDWMSAFLPIATNRYWFVTMYVALFFTMPLLNHILNTLSTRELRSLLITGFLLLSLYPTIAGQDLFVTHGGYSYLWFMYLYLVGGAISRSDGRFAIKPATAMIASVLLPILSLCIVVGCSQVEKRTGMNLGSWGFNYASPDILLEAVILLMAFSRIDVKACWMRRIIGVIGPSVFSVYVIHSNGTFRKMVGWNGRFAPLADKSIIGMLIGIVGWALLIFSCCIAIDVCRRTVLKGVKKLIRYRRLAESDDESLHQRNPAIKEK